MSRSTAPSGPLRTMGPEDAILLDYADRDDDGVTLLGWHDSSWD